MSTDLEEVFLHADLSETQYILPNLRQLHFHPRPRCNILGSALQATFRCWQCFAVDFAIGTQWHLLQLYKVRWYHVAWQLLPQRTSQLAGTDFLPGNIVGHHVFLSRFICTSHDHGFAYRFHLEQLRFDLAQFNPVPPDFHLVVDPAQIFNVPVRHPSRQIAGAVHPLIPCFPASKRIFHKFLSRQLRTVQITLSYADTADAQFPCHANWLQLLRAFLDDVQTNVLNRFPDRNNRIGSIRLAIEVRYVHRRFGWAIQIDQLRSGQARHEPLEPGHMLWRQRFTTGKDMAQCAQLRLHHFSWLLFHILQERMQHGWYKVHRAHAIAGNRVDDVFRVLFPADRQQTYL
ncbi:hypothetical protein D1872_159450 [compost metagenome]